jgi:deazaflavin-dependent oxidoreductase (nitroreductase family)
VNEKVNPLLIERDLVGTGRAEIATLEHVGRKSGAVHMTPVHPTLRDDAVLIPAPMGVGSQWAQNVLAAGTARLQLHDTVYDLDAPEVIAPSETGFYPPQLAAPFDRLGWRYVRMHVAGSAPGALSTPAA